MMTTTQVIQMINDMQVYYMDIFISTHQSLSGCHAMLVARSSLIVAILALRFVVRGALHLGIASNVHHLTSNLEWSISLR